MSEEVVRIIKEHDDWKHSVEIKDNAKGEPAVTVKSRSDEDLKALIDLALKEYKAGKKSLEEKND